MEFWKRFIKAIDPPEPRPVQVITPESRLEHFKKTWRTFVHTWRNGQDDNPLVQERLQDLMEQLVHTLIEESKRSDRLCLNFAYDQRVFLAISKVAQNGSRDVSRVAIKAFSTLLDNEEDFLSQESFALSLIDFLTETKKRTGPGLEVEFVELLFNIASKIRGNPAILPVWFTSAGQYGVDFQSLPEAERFAGVTNKDDFPLFYLLIDYVHNEAPVGEFARTGLLYIIEAASSSRELEKWIVESDLATLMASGLGALYSQLSRKLVLSYDKDTIPTILAFSDYQINKPVGEAETMSSPDFQTHLQTFLSYLIFWQDVLRNCKSTEVKQTLLDHFQVLFLQQLLYPSLIESSDIDGGSAVAVLTYVRLILDTLEHPDLINIILSYLLAIKEKMKPMVPPSKSVARRRKSLDLLTMASKDDEKSTPDLFSLVDLAITSLRSSSHQTVGATLRLVSTILRKHHPYAISTLLKVTLLDDDAPRRTIGAHNKEMEFFFSIVPDVGDFNIAAAFEAHLKDAIILLESHPCTLEALSAGLSTEGSREEGSTFAAKKPISGHRLRLDDPLLKRCVNLLSSFFSNPVEINLILTSVIVDLATCIHTRPDGWLLNDPEHYTYPNEDDDSASISSLNLENELSAALNSASDLAFLTLQTQRNQISALNRARRYPEFTSNPPILNVLENLAAQLEIYRRDIPDLDEKLSERRQAFRVTENLSEALSGSPLPPRRGRHNSSARPSSSHFGSTSPTRSDDGYGRLNSPPSYNDNTSQRKIRALKPSQYHLPPPMEDDDDEMPPPHSPLPGSPKMGAVDMVPLGKEFSLSHLLTNIMIYQEFVLELAALIQARTSLFGDVAFEA
ncbi:hypothetical protein BJ508DRAFT_410435 [Ascobolus immersus RN42]|uniref:FHF complex subunit HOOK-interacting protein C-terminal domain-containing protein n=1 Tax=Ascobolus immersus RN42 TaxID=1160509 RepID=A0A3N4INH8_ASCIM|nr:hypothetical protein BJ508DRAFT_410435 [Ascobolus immersus RN42]